MTSKEASEVLKESSIQQMSFCKVVVNGKAFNVREALDMAIRSLEAWEKIRKEIASDGQSDINAKYVLNLIDKHLSEVSE
jgi:hypothetical protein